MTIKQLFMITILALLGWVLILSFVQRLTSDDTEPMNKKKVSSVPVPAPIEVDTAPIQIKNEKASDQNPFAAKSSSERSEPLSRFLSLEEKALKSNEERIQFERILSNPFVLKNVENTLLSAEPAQFDRKSQKTRFEALQYLERALLWRENPAKEAVADTIEKIIKAPLKTSSDAVKRSRLGDKMELYTAFLGTAPERAKTLLEEVRGTNLEKVLLYASKRLTSEKQE